MRLFALACFFISGAAGLMLEVVWMRMLGLLFGTTALALSTVLASFMGGLALGSAIGGRVADRLKRPLLAYGLVEGGVAIAALCIPLVLKSPVVGALVQIDSFVWASLVKFLFASALLLVPTTLMGASLPLLARFLVRHEWESRRVGLRLGLLYGANTTGAVAGALIAGFGLLPLVGLKATNWVAIGLDLLALAAVLVWTRIQRRSGEGGSEEMTLAHFTEPPQPAVPAGLMRVAVACFAITGAAAMAQQILWTRGLAMIIGSSVYSFTIVVVAFLAGLSVGAIVFGRVAVKTTRPLEWLVAVNISAALLSLVTTAILDDLPRVFLGWLAGSGMAADTVLSLHMILAFVAIFPPTLAMGGIFPLTMQLIAGSPDRVGRVGSDVGKAYALNTVGAIVGSVLGGFVLLPLCGLRVGLLIAGCSYAAVASLLTAQVPTSRGRRALSSLSVAGIAILGAILLPKWDVIELTAGYFRTSLAREYIRDSSVKPEILFYEDGLSSTVTIEKWGDNIALKNNGKVDASSSEDMPTQIMVGLLPILLHPDYGRRPLKVLLIGYASGATAGAILQSEAAQVDVVELEGATIRASRFFEHVNHKPLDDQRLKLFVDDGRNHLLRTAERYDVIVNEPSNPWIAGVANLFTVEYFELARSRLATGGIFCSWAQLYEMAPQRIRAVYRAFSNVFPRSYVFSAGGLSSDTFLVAGLEPVLLDIQRLEKAFQDPRLRAELLRAEVDSPHDIPAYLLLSPEDLRSFVAGAEPNTDDNAIVEFGAPRDLYGHRRDRSYVSTVYGPGWPYGRLEGHLVGYERGDLAAERFAKLARSLLEHGKRAEADRFIERAGAEGEPVAQLAKLLDDREFEDPEQPLTEPAGELSPPEPPPGLSQKQRADLSRDYVAIERHIAGKRFATALDIVNAWPRNYTEAPGSDFDLVLGFLLYKNSMFREAVLRLRPLAENSTYVENRPAVLYYLGRARYANGHYGNGVETLLRWCEKQADAEKAMLHQRETDIKNSDERMD